ncbi:MAG: hypothetical protein RR292_07865 [Christensenellaceae bacterium]
MSKKYFVGDRQVSEQQFLAYVQEVEPIKEVELKQEVEQPAKAKKG